jgi:LysM repeat protein
MIELDRVEIDKQNVKQKKKVETWKVGLFAGLLGAIGYYRVKEFLFGNPPSNLRKALFFGSVATFFLYDRCGEGVESYFHRNPQISKNQQIQQSVEDGSTRAYYGRKISFDDSLRERLRQASLRAVYLEEKAAIREAVKTEVQKTTATPEVNVVSVQDVSYKPKYAEQTVSVTAETNASNWYVVQRGECLSQIARKFLGSTDRYDEIARLNNITNPDLIEIGQPLKLPLNLTNYVGVRSDPLPESEYVMHRGEDLLLFTKRFMAEKKIDVSKFEELSKTILAFNASYGNKIHDLKSAKEERAYVYIPTT